MAEPADVRRIVAELPETEDRSTEVQLAFYAGGQLLAWSYLVRPAPKKPRRPCLDVLVIRCPIERKELLVEAAPDRFFDDDHYRGYPALLVRLAAIEEDELRGLIDDGRRWTASRPTRKRKS
jgi:hypothetical protein